MYTFTLAYTDLYYCGPELGKSHHKGQLGCVDVFLLPLNCCRNMDRVHETLCPEEEHTIKVS
jgi:hypothetical protein